MWVLVVLNEDTEEIKVCGLFCCEECSNGAAVEYIKQYEGDTTPLKLTATEVDETFASEY